MAKVSGNYEVLYVLNPSLGEEETAASIEMEPAHGQPHLPGVVAGQDVAEIPGGHAVVHLVPQLSI